MNTAPLYKKTQFKDRKELFENYIKIWQFTEKDFLGLVKEHVLNPILWEKAAPELVQQRERELFKLELENMLEEYNLEKLRLFNSSLENFHSFRKDRAQEKNGEVWELIYSYLFHDQPGYRPELIRTDLDVLQTKGYI